MVEQGLSDDEDSLSIWNVLGHPIYHMGFMEQYPALSKKCTTRIFGEQRRGLVWRVLTIRNSLDGGTVTRVVAYSNFSGVMGRSRMRFPVAW